MHLLHKQYFFKDIVRLDINQYGKLNHIPNYTCIIYRFIFVGWKAADMQKCRQC